MPAKLNDNKIINAWSMYDWANSVYALVISSTIFPVYYNSATRAAFNSDQVSFFGFYIENTVLYSYSLSLSFLLIAGLSPLLSGIADSSGRRKFFMKFFTYLGGFSCIALYFFDGSNIEFGILFSILACVGYAGGIVFYNAFLPVIATPDKYDFVSARGFSLGYVGSVILLIVNILMLTFPQTFFLSSDTEAAKISFAMTGIWWIVFAQIPFYYLPANKKTTQSQKGILKKGYVEILKVWQVVQGLKVLKNFLIAFFFYSTGVQTVMYLAATFGEKELRLPADSLIMTILIIQIVAIGGAYLFAQISKMQGNKFALLCMVFIWIFICFYAYFVTTANQFYALAFIVGLVMGGIQSLSRATYSKLIPAQTLAHTSYFSFFDVVEKSSIVVGTFCYGLIEQLTGSMRNSVFALALFFLVGMGFLFLIKIPLPFSRRRMVLEKTQRSSLP
ncbi:MAG: MFS transporter [Cyclobacteriaceae bacterium]